jgi:hypothetical protein
MEKKILLKNYIKNLLLILSLISQNNNKLLEINNLFLELNLLSNNKFYQESFFIFYKDFSIIESNFENKQQYVRYFLDALRFSYVLLPKTPKPHLLDKQGYIDKI